MDSEQRRDYDLLNVEDFPDEVRDNIVYIVGEKRQEWLAVFRCPCGCREVIQLNLIKGVKPRWRVIYHKKRTFSLYPSVNRIVNCRSHFTLTRSKIRWWGESDYY
jgi:hypothetical protein